MPKVFSNIPVPYNLTGSWTTKRSGLSYKTETRESLYAWYRFERDVSASGDIADSSGNARDLVQPSAVFRPAYHADHLPSTVLSPSQFPSGSSGFGSTQHLQVAGSTDFSWGDGSSDEPFSMACWVKFSAWAGVPNSYPILSKYGSGVPNREYVLRAPQDGSSATYSHWLAMSLYEPGGGGGASVTRYMSEGMSLNKWYHIAMTYDGRGGNEAYEGIRLFKNGIDVSGEHVTVASYVAMDPGAGLFQVGAAESTLNISFSGSLGEVTVWSKELSGIEVESLYKSSYGLVKQGSGFLTNPPRTVLHDRDQQLGSYPTIARSGDINSLGDSADIFDDNKTVVFTDPYAFAEIEFLSIKLEATNTVSSFQIESELGVISEACLPAAGLMMALTSSVNGVTNIQQIEFTEHGDSMFESAASSEGYGATSNTINLSDHVGKNPWTINYASPTDGYPLGHTSGETFFPKPEQMAKLFADKVNEIHANGDFHIRAEVRAEPIGSAKEEDFRVVVLKYDVPDEGNYVAGESGEYGTNQIILAQKRNSHFTSGKPVWTETLDIWKKRNNNTNQQLKSLGISAQWPVKITQFVSPGAQASNQKIVYPILLASGNHYQNSKVATPNSIDLTMSASVPMARGISDANINARQHFISEDYTPFNETNVINRSALSTLFYEQGTPNNVMPGFSAPLTSKCTLEIDIAPNKSTHVYFATGTTSGDVAHKLSQTVSKNTSMAYYNFSLGRWEIISKPEYHIFLKPGGVLGSSGDKVKADVIDDTPANRATGQLAFLTTYNPANQHANVPRSMMDTLGEFIGQPIDSYGFPYESKYDATGSQTLDMSDYITQPFLLEKIEIQFSASFGPTYLPWVAPGDAGREMVGPRTYQFFLLNQRSGTRGSLESQRLDISANASTKAFQRTLTAGAQKDLIAVGNIAEVGTVTNTSTGFVWGPSDSDYKDLNIDRSHNYIQNASGNSGGGLNAGAQPITGTWSLKFTPKVYAKNKFLGLKEWVNSYRRTYGAFYESAPNSTGYRDSVNMSSGRSPVSTVTVPTPSIDPGTGKWKNDKTVSPYTFWEEYDYWKATVLSLTSSAGVLQDPIIMTPESSARISPYILLPTDRLVLGFWNQPNASMAGAANVWTAGSSGVDDTIRRMDMHLGSGYGKILLYGSLLVDGKSGVNNQLNQNLTSDSIHEDVHETYTDQYDVEPLLTFTGSYVDHVLNKPLRKLNYLSDPPTVNSGDDTGDDAFNKTSQIAGRASHGTLGTTGSLQRFVRLVQYGRNNTGGDLGTAGLTSETYWDSVAPSIGSYHAGLTEKYEWGFPFYDTALGSEKMVVFADWHMPNKVTISSNAFTAGTQATAQVRFTGVPTNGTTFTMADGSSLGSSNDGIFIFDTSTTTADGTRDGSNRTIVGINGCADAAAVVARAVTAINGATAPFNQITANNNSSDTALLNLAQDTGQDRGNTAILIDSGAAMVCVEGTNGKTYSGSLGFAGGRAGMGTPDIGTDLMDLNQWRLTGPKVWTQAFPFDANLWGPTRVLSREKNLEQIYAGAAPGLGDGIPTGLTDTNNAGVPEAISPTKPKTLLALATASHDWIGYSETLSTPKVPIYWGPKIEKMKLVDGEALSNKAKTLKTFFGFGDFGSANIPAGRYPTAPNNASPSRETVYRGWKYGLFNAVPTLVSCVFRRDRFGQFRDMLEQRPLVRVYEGGPANADQTTIDQALDLGATKEIRSLPPVYVNRWVQRGSLLDVDPSETNSQNLSTYFTSSLPYFDDVWFMGEDPKAKTQTGRERDSVQPDLDTGNINVGD